jgi:hypothetical protein
MSCVISISNRSEGIWGIRNTIYEWFVGLVLQRFGSDARLTESLKQSQYFQALGLDRTRSEDPALASVLTASLLVIAREIADGKHALTDYGGRPWPELQKETEHAFAALVELLTRFRQTGIHEGG